MDHLAKLAAMLSPLEVPSPQVRLTAERAARSNEYWAPAYWHLIDIKKDWGLRDPLEALFRYNMAGKVAGQLLRVPEENRENAITNNPEYHCPGVALWLLDRETHLRRVAIGQARKLAEAAVLVSKAIAVRAGVHLVREGGSKSSSKETELLSRSLARCANTWRMTGDYAKANAMMIKADRYLGPKPSQRVLAEYEFLRASLLGEQGETAGARIAMNNAGNLYAGPLADEHLAGAVDMLLGKTLRQIGQPTEAIAVTRRAIARIDRLRDPELGKAARLNLSLLLLDIGDVDEAERNWYCLRRFRAPIEELRRMAVGGLIDLHHGRLDAAETSLGKVAAQASERGHDYLFVYTMLNLAIVRLEAGKRAESIESLNQVISIYKTRNWNPHDLLAALQLLQSALTEEAIVAHALETAIKQIPVANPEKHTALPTELIVGRERK